MNKVAVKLLGIAVFCLVSPLFAQRHLLPKNSLTGYSGKGPTFSRAVSGMESPTGPTESRALPAAKSEKRIFLQPVRLSSFRSSSQMLVMTSSNWASVSGTLRRYERRSSRGQWTAVGYPITVVVGKNGLAWGVGVATGGSASPDDPIKKEGDGRAPAGMFRLGTFFGYATRKQPGWKMPYLNLTELTQCVDDVDSKFYNRVLNRDSVSPDWNSAETMLRSDDLYRWGIVIEYNSNPPLPGRGSCIFLHIWRGPGQGTVGCTAMPENELETILSWLDPRKQPFLVQLPVAQYRKLEKRWELPDILPSRKVLSQRGLE